MFGPDHQRTSENDCLSQRPNDQSLTYEMEKSSQAWLRRWYTKQLPVLETQNNPNSFFETAQLLPSLGALFEVDLKASGSEWGGMRRPMQ